MKPPDKPSPLSPAPVTALAEERNAAQLRHFALVWLVLFTMCCAPAGARRVPAWTYSDLVDKSDVVAVLEPVSNETADDSFPDDTFSQPLEDFVATNTRFRIHAVLRGNLVTRDELTLLHFAYAGKERVIVNGARFIRFDIRPPSKGQDRGTEIEVPARRVSTFWLAFLRRRADGRFEPVTGHYDSSRSFRELREPGIVAVAEGYGEGSIPEPTRLGAAATEAGAAIAIVGTPRLIESGISTAEVVAVEIANLFVDGIEPAIRELEARP